MRTQGYVETPNAWVDPLGLATCPVREVNGTKIHGTGQKDGTPGHDQLSELIANKLAMSGKFAAHLGIRIEGAALEEWIASEPMRGTLTRIGSEHWLWEVGALHLDSVNRSCGEAGILLAWKPPAPQKVRRALP